MLIWTTLGHFWTILGTFGRLLSGYGRGGQTRCTSKKTVLEENFQHKSCSLAKVGWGKVPSDSVWDPPFSRKLGRSPVRLAPIKWRKTNSLNVCWSAVQTKTCLGITKKNFRSVGQNFSEVYFQTVIRTRHGYSSWAENLQKRSKSVAKGPKRPKTL